jgi:demethylmenaquinone methyltransferase / 2-methoxy-6-polyprenyl-1,4-benzoquinol methylase
MELTYPMTVNQHISQKNAAEFQTQQDDVFGRIANRYDLLCDLFSFGIHRLWKRRVADAIAREDWSRLLDCATGTGDIILRILSHKTLENGQCIIASDISPQMLTVAQKRLNRSGAPIEYQILDAHSMPNVPSESVDLYSISLGLKICEREKVLREALRVLQPGGRLVVLEASNIRRQWLHRMYLGYMRFCMPVIGWAATGGDTSAYKYLLRGIEHFPAAEDLASELVSIGFEDVSFERLSLGIVAIHVARKPFTVLK